MSTTNFLASVDTATKNGILDNVAAHYGITRAEAFAEVTDSEAEHLLDYVTGPARTATSLLMKRSGFALVRNEESRPSIRKIGFLLPH